MGWDDAFRIVCGEVGLPPSEFYRLLYCELVLILEGFRKRHARAARERHEESAWIVSWLLIPHKNADADPITPDQLMGRKPRGKPAPAFVTDEAKARALVEGFRAQSKEELTDGK
jgi:hypothetical protein